MKNTNKFDISNWGGDIKNVLINFLLYGFKILFNNDPQQISFNSAEQLSRKLYRNIYFYSVLPRFSKGQGAI